MAVEPLISWLYEYANGIATTIAIILSSLSLFIQFKREKRQIGKLEVSEIRNATYTPGGEFEDAYGDEATSDTLFSVDISGRNINDGTLYIHNVIFTLEDSENEVPLTTYDGSPVELSDRAPFDEHFSGRLDHQIELGEEVSGILQFETSSDPVTRRVTFNKKETPPGY